MTNHNKQTIVAYSPEQILTDNEKSFAEDTANFIEENEALIDTKAFLIERNEYIKDNGFNEVMTLSVCTEDGIFVTMTPRGLLYFDPDDQEAYTDYLVKEAHTADQYGNQRSWANPFVRTVVFDTENENDSEVEQNGIRLEISTESIYLVHSDNQVETKTLMRPSRNVEMELQKKGPSLEQLQEQEHNRQKHLGEAAVSGA